MDELWSEDIRETEEHTAERAGKVLDRIFEDNEHEICASLALRFDFADDFL